MKEILTITVIVVLIIGLAVGLMYRAYHQSDPETRGTFLTITSILAIPIAGPFIALYEGTLDLVTGRKDIFYDDKEIMNLDDAIWANRPTTAKRLINEQNIDVNNPGEEWLNHSSPLRWAIHTRAYQVAEVLLEEGAHVEHSPEEAEFILQTLENPRHIRENEELEASFQRVKAIVEEQIKSLDENIDTP